MSNQLESTSKFLSFVLRHQPEAIGLTLDAEGWASVSELIERANNDGQEITPELLDEVVETNSKKRFAFNADKTKIRANQGHSVAVDLKLEPVAPPNVLYHGTATRFLDSIKQQGLISGSRTHVHLSADIETAVSVGKRHGKPAVLLIDAGSMPQNGHKFFISENSVWLTDSVPPSFIDFESNDQ